MNRILYLFYLTILVLAILSCANTLSKSYDEDNLESDLIKLISSNEVNASDTALMTKYIAFTKFKDENLDGKTYAYILDEGKKLKQKASWDLNSLQTILESRKERMNIKSAIIDLPTPYFYNDTIKYFYVLLLINGISNEDKVFTNVIIQRLGSLFPETIDMASALVLERKSFNPLGAYYDDNVADKKIMYFAFHGRKNDISFLRPFEKELYRRNGWKVVEIP